MTWKKFIKDAQAENFILGYLVQSMFIKSGANINDTIRNEEGKEVDKVYEEDFFIMINEEFSAEVHEYFKKWFDNRADEELEFIKKVLIDDNAEWDD